MSDDELARIRRLCKWGLVVAVLGNLAALWMEATNGMAYIAPGQVVAILMCVFAFWLIRARERGRL